MTLRVAARTRIPIPVPSTADPVGGFQHLDGQTKFVTQSQQLEHAGKAGADDKRVKLQGLVCGGIQRIHRIISQGCFAFTSLTITIIKS